MSHQSCRGRRCPSRRKHIVDDENTLPALYCIFMNLQRVSAVLESIALPYAFRGQLPRLANGYESGPQTLRNGASKNEASTLDPYDDLDRVIAKVLPEISAVL
jgi:hypothetical protein